MSFSSQIPTPTQKLLKITKGATFDYQFQFLMGNPGSALGFDLTNYTGQWIIHPSFDEPIVYTTSSSDLLTPVGQIGTVASFLSNMRVGMIGAGTTIGNETASGVYFGGDADDPTNGMIDLVISAEDTDNIDWSIGTYTFSIISETDVVTLLLTGGIGVIGTT